MQENNNNNNNNKGGEKRKYDEIKYNDPFYEQGNEIFKSYDLQDKIEMPPFQTNLNSQNLMLFNPDNLMGSTSNLGINNSNGPLVYQDVINQKNEERAIDDILELQENTNTHPHMNNLISSNINHMNNNILNNCIDIDDNNMSNNIMNNLNNSNMNFMNTMNNININNNMNDYNNNFNNNNFNNNHNININNNNFKNENEESATLIMSEEFEENDETEMIIRINNNLDQIEQNISEVRRSIISNNPNKNLLINLRNVMIQNDKELRGKLRDVILSWPAIHKINCMVLRMNYLKQQLAIYESEIVQLFEHKAINKPQDLVSIAFTVQQYPQVFKNRPKQNQKKPHCKISARILTGAITNFTPYKNQNKTPTISLAISSGKKKGSPIEIKVLGEKMEGLNLEYDLVFQKGTSLSASILTINIDGDLEIPKGQKTKITAISQNPVPLIVTTNENQWSKGQKTLLSFSLYGDTKVNKSATVPFQMFCNFFLPYFIESTRQNSAKEFVIRMLDKSEIFDSDQVFSKMLKRPVYDVERRFFKNDKFQTKNDIKFSDFESFWEWCGIILQVVRHNDVMRNYYLEGLILGFLSKEECNRILSTEENCSFIIRFSSSSHKGELALAQKNSQGEANHSILEAKNVPPLGNLADHLKNQQNLKSSVRTVNGKEFQTVSKQELFSKYYAPDQELREGYEKINYL